MNIGLLIDGFGWGGGIDLLKRYAMALDSQDCKIYLMVFDKDTTFSGVLKRIKTGIIVFLKRILRKKVPAKSNINETINSFLAISNKIECLHLNKANLNKVCKNNKIDILFPSIGVLSKKIKIPWIGYVYDFQHKYYPNLFTKRSIAVRDKEFKKMLNKSEAIIVNSYDTKKDCDLFVPHHKSRIYVAPFYPVPKASWLEDKSEIIEKYPTQSPYIIISNQLWVHKGHGDAIDALSILVNNYGMKDIKLICTGSTFDYRFPDYFDKLQDKINSYGLKENVFFVGFVSKEEQIELIKHSTVVLQPTMFEGGPGGGIASDAIALGKRILLSDINVNKEIVNELAFFFKAGDKESLAAELKEIINSNPK